MRNDTTLAHARAECARGRWASAYAAYADAAGHDRLGPTDLAEWASAALLSGHDDEGCDLLTSAYEGLLHDGDEAAAARCALWACLNLANRGRFAALGAWQERAARIAATNPDSIVQGYLAVPEARRLAIEGDARSALECSRLASTVAATIGDHDLGALGRLGEGHALVLLGETTSGLVVLDDVMLDVSSGVVSPLVVGIVYCAVIQLCRESLDLRRAREWTYALDGWCERQPELVPFRGTCRIHRSQVLLESDDWDAALGEADRAVAALSRPRQAELGLAWYQKAEVLRLRGELAAAQEAFAAAYGAGADPMPGLALVWAALGRPQDAHDALTARLDGPGRSPVLFAAAVDVALAAGDLAAAGRAVDRLETAAAEPGANLCVRSLAASARGSVLLARGDARAALGLLTRAVEGWLELDVPYEVARVRVVLATAHETLGQTVEAAMDRESATATFARLGALADLERLGATVDPALRPSPLTTRETEVLRLVATGRTNRAVAAALSLSERTVARHVSNIFVKLDLPSRAAATAWAYEHGLIEPDAS